MPPLKEPDMIVTTEPTNGYASILIDPAVAAMCVIHSTQSKATANKIDIDEMLNVLRKLSSEIHGGNISNVEAMLMNQATALQALFVKLVERGMKQDIITNIEGFMKLALRAQSQCRATLETLATIKNPPIVYARQANVTSGPQQINNGTSAPTHAREIENEQSKLLDARAAGEAVSSNSTLEAVAKVDRAKVRRRKGEGGA